MPLPLVQIGVFLGVFVPWIVLLRLEGVPFGGGGGLALYFVPPGVVPRLSPRPAFSPALLPRQPSQAIPPRGVPAPSAAAAPPAPPAPRETQPPVERQRARVRAQEMGGRAPAASAVRPVLPRSPFSRCGSVRGMCRVVL